MLGSDRDLIVSDGRFTTQLAQECPELEAHIRRPGQEMNAALAQILEDLGQRRVAPRGHELDDRRLRVIRAAAPTVAFLGVKGRVEALRQIKDEDEIAAIREAVRYAERAFAMLRAGLRTGESEKDVADPLESYLAALRRNRSEFSADRRGGPQVGLAPCTANIDDQDWPGRFRPDRLGSNRSSL